jgi:TRAP-type uncharacterized transport system substrate-binding protein
MQTKLREHFPSGPARRFALAVFGSVVALVVLGMWAVASLLHPLPPRTLVMTTGAEGSAYAELGKRYQELLARKGVELRLLPSAGDLDNLARLRDPNSGVSIGFLQGGITRERDAPGLASLGAIAYEPLWLFYRGAVPGPRLAGLHGRRLSIGPLGSGTRVLALELFARSGIDRHFAVMLPLAPEQAAEKLLHGDIDAALISTSWKSPVVQRLLAAPGIGLAGFPHTDAFVALYPYLTKLRVPAGVGNLAQNQPPADVELLATQASLVVQQDLHPAIQYLLLDAAEQIHAGPGIFQRAGRFPAAESIDLPLSGEARHFYKSGQPFLQRYLPFWLAVLMDQLLILLIPVAGVLYPLLRIMPAAYNWGMQQRIFRLYRELRALERAVDGRVPGPGATDLVTRLERLEQRASNLQVPATYANLLYSLRNHIAFVRARLSRV